MSLIPAEYSRILSTRSIRLQLPVKSGQDGGNYVCKMKKANGDVDVIANQIVDVEHYPQKVKNIDCHVYNWYSMTCRWDLGVQYVHPDNVMVELVWAVSDGSQYDCPKLTKTSCVWVQDATRDRFRVDMIYTMAVAVTNNRTQTNKTTVTSDIFKIDTSEIVQPAPVKDLTYNTSSTCLTLTWNHSAPVHKKIYRLQFSGEWDDRSEGKNVEVQEQSYTTCGLRPHTWYKVRIACRPVHWDGKSQTGYWSEEMALSLMTKEDLPAGAPQVLEGSYAVHSCDFVNCRNVIVYWKGVDPHESNGNITRYRLIKKDLSTHDVISRELGNVTNYQLSLADDRSYKIRFQAGTSVGYSPYSTEIIIPSRSNEPAPVDNFLVEYDDDQSSGKQWLDLQWTAPAKVKRRIVSYTLYWCHGNKRTQKCKTEIDWKILPKRYNYYRLPITKEVLKDLILGISVEVEVSRSTKYSSGISWNNCIYIKNSKPGTAPRNFRLSPIAPDTSIKVEWDRFLCHEAQGYITTFNIYHCLIDEEKNCSGQAKSLVVNGRATNAIIPGLEQGKSYMFWMEAVSESGRGPQTLPIYAVVPFSELQPEEIAGIVVAVLFVFALAMCGVVCCIKRCYKTVKQEFKPYEIVVPNISLPSIPMPQSSPSEIKPTVTADDENDDDDDDSIYAEIDDNVSDPSTPGSVSGVEAPLINNNIPATLNKSKLYGENTTLKNKSSLTDGIGYHSNLKNSMESFLLRLNNSSGSNMSEKFEKKKLNMNQGYLTPNGSIKHEKKPSSDPNLLGDKNCSPYHCTDIINTDTRTCEKIGKKMNGPYGKDIHSEGSMYGDPSYGTNDLSLAPTRSQPSIPWREQLENNVCEQFNIKHTLDRRKTRQSDCYNESVVSDDMNNLSGDCSAMEMMLSAYVPGLSSGNSECCSQPVKSYCKFGMEIPSNNSSAFLMDNPNMPCSNSARNNMPAPPQGYVGHEQLSMTVSHNTNSDSQESGGRISGPREGEGRVMPGDSEGGVSSQRPVSEVVNVPAHFYGSLSLLDDDGTVTEL
ncbi:hypothetical protein FSP39_017683 [Pinctada imbricata]|uniref:Fibronectin type-III domain-containing protein n=1 Tax=Pinctada imbricata TaxID=66713 RepID=A0AA88XT02_PINIB|nr:hypothetical protein FSP39_017683 [Pinctada imbricata]